MTTKIMACRHVISKKLGSRTSAEVFIKLEYYFSYKKFNKGFFKFAEPCQHFLYREGDSWCEELDVTRKTFLTAFDKIGIRYNSKNEYRSAGEDKFQGKMYASYFDRKKNMTYYFRNHDVVDDFVVEILKLHADFLNSRKINAGKSKIPSPDIINNNYINSKKTNIFSFNEESQIIANKNKEKTIIQNFSLNKNEESKAIEMIQIWEDVIGDTCLKFKCQNLYVKLFNFLKNFFSGSLEKWKKYLSLLKSSRFLMGEVLKTKFKKPFLLWAVKDETVKNILGQKFSLGDRVLKNQELIDLYKDIREIPREIERLEEAEKREKLAENKEKSQFFKDKFEQLSESEKNEIIHTFEQDFSQKDIPNAALLKDVFFGSYIEQQLEQQYRFTGKENMSRRQIQKLNEKLKEISSKAKTLIKNQEKYDFPMLLQELNSQSRVGE